MNRQRTTDIAFFHFSGVLPGVCTEEESWEWFGPLKLAAYSELLRASKGMFVERGTKASELERPLAESKAQEPENFETLLSDPALKS